MKDPMVTRAVLLHVEMIRADNKARIIQIELARMAATMTIDQFRQYMIECGKNGVAG